MAVGLQAPSKLLPIAGLRLASTHAGIKADPSRDDLVLIELEPGSSLAGVFTRNRFCAAPVILARRHLASRADGTRYLLINSGNANAGTGEPGLQAALQTCRAVADVASVPVDAVLPFSTGVIGELLPAALVDKAIPRLHEALGANAWLPAARGIMTTDTLPKGASRRIEIDGRTVTLTGICKGSGMIRPDMATMLAFVATDAQIAAEDLQPCLQQAVDVSFNAITVDGDTSTNDACMLIATGRSGVAVDASHPVFRQALVELFQQLAQSIVRDGEGATKFVEVRVEGAQNREDARGIAYTVAHSPLVKTALFASDPNWGRILAAVGRAPVAGLDIGRVDLYLGEVRLIHRGEPDPEYREELGQAVMDREEILIRVCLNLGEADARVWTTDLSYEYVKINAEYRT